MNTLKKIKKLIRNALKIHLGLDDMIINCFHHSINPISHNFLCIEVIILP